MRRYELEKEREGSTVYFFIRDVETLDIVLLPTKYLMHKIRSKCSPNTVRRSALAILYYLEYIHEKKKEAARGRLPFMLNRQITLWNFYTG